MSKAGKTKILATISGSEARNIIKALKRGATLDWRDESKAGSTTVVVIREHESGK